MTHSHHAEHNHHHSTPGHQGHGAPVSRHTGHSVAGFRDRFWVSLVLTIPVVVLSPMLQHWSGLGEQLRFAGDQVLLFAFASAVFFYGGWPFLTGLLGELRGKTPGMMTLVAMAITTAYAYSTAVVFGLPGEGFFWELAALGDSMLRGHGIEMRSLMGA